MAHEELTVVRSSEQEFNGTEQLQQSNMLEQSKKEASSALSELSATKQQLQQQSSLLEQSQMEVSTIRLELLAVREELTVVNNSQQEFNRTEQQSNILEQSQKEASSTRLKIEEQARTAAKQREMMSRLHQGHSACDQPNNNNTELEAAWLILSWRAHLVRLLCHLQKH